MLNFYLHLCSVVLFPSFFWTFYENMIFLCDSHYEIDSQTQTHIHALTLTNQRYTYEYMLSFNIKSNHIVTLYEQNERHIFQLVVVVVAFLLPKKIKFFLLFYYGSLCGNFKLKETFFGYCKPRWGEEKQAANFGWLVDVWGGILTV